MENTKKESNAVLSKLSEEQFNIVGNYLGYRLDTFDGFYPTLNTELLTKVKEQFNSQNLWRVKFYEFLTEDEFISIVKDYGSVSHSLMVDGKITYEPTDLSDYITFDISTEKIEEIGVDVIEKWGVGGYGFVRLEENLKSHSMMDEYPSGLENYVINDCDFNPADSNDIYVDGVRVTTKVNLSLPNREELLPEKLVA